MSAKPGKKSTKKSASPVPLSAAGPAAPVPARSNVSPSDPVGASVPAIESKDPRRRLIGQIVLTVVWLYVAALWLLALDQTFDWGIFGPPLPPLP